MICGGGYCFYGWLTVRICYWFISCINIVVECAVMWCEVLGSLGFVGVGDALLSLSVLGLCLFVDVCRSLFVVVCWLYIRCGLGFLSC